MIQLTFAGAVTDLGRALNAFMTRRYERCPPVVGEMERDKAPREQHDQFMRASMAALLTPI